MSDHRGAFQEPTRLLIAEPPLQVLPSLAVAIGLNEAIVLQQLHYWLQHSGKERDGRRWVYNTYEGWKQQFPWWGIATIKRIFANLRRRGLIVTGNYNATPLDRTVWYSIDYDALNALAAESPSDQIDPMEGINLIQSSGSTRSDGADQSDPMESINLIRPIPETNHETTTETTQETSVAPARARARKRDAGWEALVAFCGYTPIDPSERRGWNRALRSLREQGASDQDIAEACRRYVERWPDVERTPYALAKHYKRLMATRPPGRRGKTAADYLRALEAMEASGDRDPEFDFDFDTDFGPDGGAIEVTGRMRR